MTDEELSHVRIISAEKPEDWDRAKELFLEYAGSLGFDLGFQDFEDELSGLPGGYAPPRGRLLLAVEGDQAVGCVALREIGAGVCEMKRLYVRPGCRGKGTGRALADAIVEEARRVGYQKMRLDAIRTMKRAVELYASMGFKEIPAYRFNPIDGAVYMELALE